MLLACEAPFVADESQDALLAETLQNLTSNDSASSAAREPDYQAFVAMVDEHGGALLAMLRRLCRNQHNAEDVFQETATKVWKSFADRPRLTNPRGWLMTIGYRVFLDNRRRMQPPEPTIESADVRTRSPEEQAASREDASRLHGAIARLPEASREILTLHYSGGLTLRETAAAMNLPDGTVKSRLNAALNQLRGMLQCDATTS